LALCLCVSAQQRPKIQETFEAHGYLHVTVDGKNYVSGRGNWLMDQPHGKGLHRFEFWNNHHLNQFELSRYDLSEDFMIREGLCDERSVKPPMPTHWQWLNQATYAGNETIDGHLFDMWTQKEATRQRTLTVARTTPNTPVYLKTENSTHVMILHFEEFHTRQADPKWFEVPSICNYTREAEEHEHFEPPKDIHLASSQEVSRLLAWLKANMTERPGDACASAAYCAGVICGQCHCPYVYGGEENCCQTHAGGLDCSGLCQYSYSACGHYGIPRTTQEMWASIHGSCNGCSPENTGPCISGDLMFYYPSSSGPDHVMMYTGGGYAAECPHTGEDCRILRPYSSPFVGCRRVC